MKASFCRVVILWTLVMVGVSQDLKTNSLCDEFNYLESKVNFQIKASILLNNTLFLIALLGQRLEHIVHEIPLIDISLREDAIFLDDSMSMTMKAKWGFDPIDSNQTLISAFPIKKAPLINQDNSDYIAFIYQTGGQVLCLSTKQVESSTDWNPNDRLILSLDHEGYIFKYDQYWLARECSLHGNQLVLQSDKYFLMDNPKHFFLLFKKIGPRIDENFLDWRQLSGFIFYNRVHLFSDKSVYVFEDSREFGKVGFEHPFAYRKYPYEQFFHCRRDRKDIELHYDENTYDDLENFHHIEVSSGLNKIMLGLFVIVLASFCIRSQIMKRKCAKYY